MKLREFGEFQKLPSSINNLEFRKFINECFNNRYTIYDDSNLNQDKVNDRKQLFLTFDGDYIKARNYIGFISYEGEDFTIYPKIFDDNINKEYLDRYLSTNLIYWLNKSERIKLPIVDVNLNFENIDSFIEVLIYIFSKYTKKLIYNKPFKTYEEVNEESEFLKGRLNINSYLKNNISTGKWNKFNCSYEPFKYNNKFNQIIKFVSKMVLSVTKNKESRSFLQNIIFILDEVDDINCTVYDCRSIILNRLQNDYDVVLKFCEMFLSNVSISIGDKENKLNFCFLVPMELLFEDFIVNFIKEKFSDDLKEITKQKSNLYLADLYVDNDFCKRAFNLRQDIYIKDKDDNESILDTKYKILDKTDKTKFGVSQGDMYQMTSYALRGGYKNLGLVYPNVKEMGKKLYYVIKSPFMSDEISIGIYTVSFVIDYGNYLNELDKEKLLKSNDDLIYEQIKDILDL